MHVGDTIFIFCLALIIFGPKKLPEIGRQIGKLMVEFRRASNEFKMQIEEELRASEESERQKEITAAKTISPSSESMTSTSTTSESAALAAAVAASGDTPGVPVIAPPSTGLPVNHTFGSADASPETDRDAWKAEPADAYPEPESGFNAGLNTASNGLGAETAVEAAPAATNGFGSEPIEFANAIPGSIDAAKVQATVPHD